MERQTTYYPNPTSDRASTAGVVGVVPYAVIDLELQITLSIIGIILVLVGLPLVG